MMGPNQPHGQTLDHFHRRLELALNQEWPQLDKMQRQLARLRPTAIQPLPGPGSLVPIGGDSGDRWR